MPQCPFPGTSGDSLFIEELEMNYNRFVAAFISGTGTPLSREIKLD
jgi:hypothetical protein